MSDFVQPDALPKIYADAGALILPSRYDSWGVVALEGCAAGLPVVAETAEQVAVSSSKPIQP